MSYLNSQHQVAYAQALELAAELGDDELHESVTVIANTIRRLPVMYHKRSLCERMARKTINFETARRERFVYD